MASLSVAQLWDWRRQQHMDAWLPSRRQPAFRRLELTAPLKNSACKLNTQ